MKIVSGGQTGVDTAALEFARNNELAYGGWVPKGRMNEGGRIPDQFSGLSETQSAAVAERTRLNVETSDATLIFVDGSTSPGTQQTLVFAEEAQKPHLVVDLREGVTACAQQILVWFAATPITVLNIAGPRASEAPEIETKVSVVLENILAQLRA